MAFNGPVLGLHANGVVRVGSGCRVNGAHTLTGQVHGIEQFGAVEVVYGGREISVSTLSTLIQTRDWVLGVTMFGNRLFAATMHNRVEVYMVEDGRWIETVEGPRHALLYSANISVSPGGIIEVVGGGVLASVHFWSIDGASSLGSDTKFQKGSSDIVVEYHKGSVFRIRRKHNLLLTTSDDRSVALWKDRRVVKKFPDHLARVWDSVWVGERIATACEDGLIRVFNQDGENLRVLHGHSKDVRVLAADGDRLYSGGEDGNCFEWELTRTSRRETEWQLPLAGDWIRTIHLRLDESVVVVTNLGRIFLVADDLSYREVLRTTSLQSLIVTASAVSRDTLYLGLVDGSVVVGNLGFEKKNFTNPIPAVPQRVVSMFVLPENACILANANGDLALYSNGLISHLKIPGPCGKLLSFLKTPIGFLFGDDLGFLHEIAGFEFFLRSRRVCKGKLVCLEMPEAGWLNAHTADGRKFSIRGDGCLDENFPFVESAAQRLSYSCGTHSKFAVGFASTDFVIHDQICVQFQYKCGGHRRPFDFKIEPNRFLFVHAHNAGFRRVVGAPICSTVRAGSCGDLVHAVVNLGGGRVLTGCEDGRLRVLDEQSLELISEMDSHEGSVRAICRVGQTFVVSAGARSQACLWRVGDEAGELDFICTRRFGMPKNDVRIMGVAGDQHGIDRWEFCLVDSTARVHFWLWPSNEISTIAPSEIQLSTCLSVCAHVGSFVVGSSNGFLTLLAGLASERFRESSRTLDSVRIHSNGVNAVASFHQFILSVSDDQSLVVSRVVEGRIQVFQRIQNASVCSIRAVHVEGDSIFTTGTDRRLRQWKFEGGIVEVSITSLEVTDPLAICGGVVVAGRGIQRV